MDVVDDVHSFVSRVVRVAVESTDASPDTVLVAQLLCAVADGDTFLIEETAETIRNRGTDEPFERVDIASSPFNILHYASIAPTAKSMEKVLLLEKDLERVTPIDVCATSTSKGGANGATPLHIVAIRGLFPEAKMLIAAGADPRAVRQKHITVVHDATNALERALPSIYYMYAQRPKKDEQAASPTSNNGNKKKGPQRRKNFLSGDAAAEDDFGSTGGPGGGPFNTTVTFSPGSTMQALGSTGGTPKNAFSSALKSLGPGRAKDGKSRLQALVQSVKMTNAMSSLYSLGGESEASTSYAPTPARDAMKSMKTTNPNELRRIKLLAGMTQFNLVVLLVGRGGDPGIHSVPGCTLSEEAAILIVDVQREVTRRMQEREGVGLEAVEQAHKKDTEKKLRPEESCRPSHQLFISEVLAFRCQKSHGQRLAGVTVSSPEKNLTAERLGPLLTAGQFVIVSIHSEYIPPRLTKKWVDKRLKVLRDREDELADGNIPEPLRMSQSNLHQQANALRAIPSMARLQLLAPPSYVKKSALRPSDARSPGVGARTSPSQQFGSMSISFSNNQNNSSMSRNHQKGSPFLSDVPFVSEMDGSTSGSPTAKKSRQRRGQQGGGGGGNLAADQSVVTFASFRSNKSNKSQGSYSSGQSPRGNNRSFLSRHASGRSFTSERSERTNDSSDDKRDLSPKNRTEGPTESAAFKQSKGIGLPSTICGEVMFVGPLRAYKQKGTWHQQREKHQKALEDGERRSTILGNQQPLPPGLMLPKVLAGGSDANSDHNGLVSNESMLSSDDFSSTASPVSPNQDAEPTPSDPLTAPPKGGPPGSKRGRQVRSVSITMADIEDEHLGDERMFVGLAVPPEFGNCDGRYLGDGIHYFDVPQGYGGLMLPMADVELLSKESDVTTAKHRLRRIAQQVVASEKAASGGDVDQPFSAFAGRETKEHANIPFSGHSGVKGNAKNWQVMAQRTNVEMKRKIRAKQQEEKIKADKVRAARHHI